MAVIQFKPQFMKIGVLTQPARTHTSGSAR
jgi:hypothetical protein